jgi:hypothetical protein
MPGCIDVAWVSALNRPLVLAAARPLEAPTALDQTAPVDAEREADLDAAVGSLAGVVDARLLAGVFREGSQIRERLLRQRLRRPRSPFEPLAATEVRFSMTPEACAPRILAVKSSKIMRAGPLPSYGPGR